MKPRYYTVSGNNKGLPCPYKVMLCQEGFCGECQVFLDWDKSQEREAYLRNMDIGEQDGRLNQREATTN